MQMRAGMTTPPAPSLPREVLIVEDDPIQLKAYEAVARRHGISLRSTSRTTDVLRLVMVHRPDAILLDVELEDGQSLKVLRCLRESPETQDIPVAVVSGYLSNDTMHFIESLDAVPMLAKPWTLDQLLGVLLALGAMRLKAA